MSPGWQHLGSVRSSRTKGTVLSRTRAVRCLIPTWLGDHPDGAVQLVLPDRPHAPAVWTAVVPLGRRQDDIQKSRRQGAAGWAGTDRHRTTLRPNATKLQK